MSERHTWLIYDREDYAGAGWAPGYVPESGQVRYAVNHHVVGREPYPFGQLVGCWGARTLEEARALVPQGGRYFDRSGNHPSPMVPIEGWEFSATTEGEKR